MKRRSSSTKGPWGRLAAGALAIALLGLLAWWLWPAGPYALPGGDWRLFKKRFLAVDGRVVDDGNGGISHSEGQGYGMLFAAAYRDRAAFDRIWGWTHAHLQRKDFLFSWKWIPSDGGKVADENNATDGDLLLAWALLKGFKTWNDYKYKQAAGQIVITLLEKMTVETYLGRQLLPGSIGFQKPAGLVINPSYYILPAFTELAETFPSDKWPSLRAGAAALLGTAQFGQWKLPPDWALLAEGWVALAPGHDEVFGYNAIRVPLHVAWDDPRSPLLKSCAAFWESAPAVKWVPATVNLRYGSFGPNPALPGMLAVRDLTLACAKNNKLAVTDIPRLDTEESYYSASLKLLVKLAIRDRFAPKRD